MLRWKFIWMLILFLPGALMLTSVACSPDAPTAPTSGAVAPGAAAMISPPVGPVNIYAMSGDCILASDGGIYHGTRIIPPDDLGCSTPGNCPWGFKFMFDAPVGASSVRLFSRSTTSSSWWIVDTSGGVWRREHDDADWEYIGTPQFTPTTAANRPPVTATTE
jgi:hypothetical protein